MRGRDRHGRRPTRSVLPRSLPGFRTRRQRFDDTVSDAAERLATRWAREWGRLEIGVEDVPPSDPAPWEDGVLLARLFPADAGQPARIIIYRRPVERRSAAGNTAPLVRDVLAENLAQLLSKAPEEIDPSYGT